MFDSHVSSSVPSHRDVWDSASELPGLDVPPGVVVPVEPELPLGVELFSVLALLLDSELPSDVDVLLEVFSSSELSSDVGDFPDFAPLIFSQAMNTPPVSNAKRTYFRRQEMTCRIQTSQMKDISII